MIWPPPSAPKILSACTHTPRSRESFGLWWPQTASPAAAHTPPKGQKILGFAAYECTRRGFLGPMEVAKSSREKGIGTALRLCAMHAMFEMGYVYGIIGGVGPVEFYRKTVGAIEIPDSTPGIYMD